MKTIVFNSGDTHQREFTAALRKNVHDYFTERKLSMKGNYTMYVKSIVMLALYIAPFILILILPENNWLALFLSLVMGIGMAGVGMSVMHDAVHGSYSRRKWVNEIMGRTIYLIGSSNSTWSIQHNYLHHTFTNITGYDEDIDTKGFIRLSVNAPWKRYQRFQQYYAFLFYGFMTLAKLIGDFPQLWKYNAKGLTAMRNQRPVRVFLVMIVTKTVYLGATIGLPIWLTHYAWWQILLGFLLMHMTGGMIMSTVFQMAHVVEGAEQPMPNESGVIPNEWLVHEMRTTSDFAPDNWLVNWYVGGLNYQIEHHLFPNICHVHYRNIAPIVESTARQFGITYNRKPTFLNALASHRRVLKSLGKGASA